MIKYRPRVLLPKWMKEQLNRCWNPKMSTPTIQTRMIKHHQGAPVLGDTEDWLTQRWSKKCESHLLACESSNTMLLLRPATGVHEWVTNILLELEALRPGIPDRYGGVIHHSHTWVGRDTKER